MVLSIINNSQKAQRGKSFARFAQSTVPTLLGFLFLIGCSWTNKQVKMQATWGLPKGMIWYKPGMTEKDYLQACRVCNTQLRQWVLLPGADKRYRDCMADFGYELTSKDTIAMGPQNIDGDIHGVKYEILREWQPYKENTQNGLGLEIVIPISTTKEQIVNFIKVLSQGKDPVNIEVWTCRKAWSNANNKIYGDLYDKNLICVYIKNTTVKRAHYNVNKIRWMQEKGKFSYLFGTETQM